MGKFLLHLPCWPRLGAIYTVSAFAQIEGCPGVHLRELQDVCCECHGLSGAPWPIEIFRALDQRKTDISALTKIANTTKTPERA